MSEGTLEQVLAGTAQWCVVHGDSLHVLRTLPVECVDAYVTDPPYSSGGAFRGDRAQSTTTKYVSTDSSNREIPAFDGDVRDQRAFCLWLSLWSAEALRTARGGAHMVAFTDWRQLPSTCDSLQAGGWLWRGVPVWDKGPATRPRNGGFRGQCEFMAWLTKGPLIESGLYLDGCFQIQGDRDKLHQAVKPLPLMERLVTLAPVGGLVVDPFCGSGTTAVAAMRQGRRVITIESNDHWAVLARERLRAEQSGSTLQAQRAGQIALFGSTP